MLNLDRHPKLKSKNDPDKDTFDHEDGALLDFLSPARGAGTTMLQSSSIRNLHDRNAGDFTQEIIQLLDQGKTVILDLGNAEPETRKYFSSQIAEGIYYHQVEKFSNNDLGSHYIQLYFEEAHNLFPPIESYTRKAEELSIYNKIAKEGAKFHLGMVYATQSVTSIDKDLVNQTENFFIAHL